MSLQTQKLEQDKKWNDMYIKLIDYKSKKDSNYSFEIINWISWQRRQYKNLKLSDYRTKKLNDICFIFETQFCWDRMYHKLTKKGYENINKDVKLYNWILLQAKQYKNNRLDKNRIEKLQLIGIKFDIINTNELNKCQIKKNVKQQKINSNIIKNDTVEKRSWKESYNKLAKYESKNHHCNVSKKEDCRLNRWILHQIYLYENGRLEKDQIYKLQLINVNLCRIKTYDAIWEESYNKLVQYELENHSCNVSEKEDFKLNKWVYAQRKLFKYKKLSEERILKLNNIGFKFDSNCGLTNDTWNKNYDKLVEYKKQHGNCNVNSYKNKKLYYWVHQQVNGITHQNVDKIKKLKLLGVDFNKSKTINEPKQKWIKSESIKEYIENSDSNKQLLTKKYNLKTVKANRCSWEESYCKLIKYQSVHNHCNVSEKEDFKLNKWVYRQRYLFNLNKLSEERILKLNNIGFKFYSNCDVKNNTLNKEYENKISEETNIELKQSNMFDKCANIVKNKFKKLFS